MKIEIHKTIEERPVKLCGKIGDIEFYSLISDEEILYLVKKDIVLGKIKLEASQTEISWAFISEFKEIK